MSAYLERTRRMSSVPLTYICVCERMIIRWHTLIPYTVVWMRFKENGWRYLFYIFIVLVWQFATKLFYCFARAHRCNWNMSFSLSSNFKKEILSTEVEKNISLSNYTLKCSYLMRTKVHMQFVIIKINNINIYRKSDRFE